VLDDPVRYIAGAGHGKQIFLGALLELLLIIANIGTAVVIFPIVRRTAVMFGVDHPSGTLQGLATIPEGLWELFLGVYCTVKGFRPAAVAALATRGRVEGTPAIRPA
jgi:hypothetical protein